ncbi:TlpA family protein disulfide reductase [Microbacterium sp. NPDC055903]
MPLTTAVVIVIAVIVLATAIGLLLRSRDGRRRAGGGLRVDERDLPSPLGTGATLVQFSTELCARCPQVRRMLGGIAESVDDVAYIDVDLTDRADLATRYHVLQTPTAFLVDASGTVLSRWGGVPDRSAIIEALRAVPTLQEQR